MKIKITLLMLILTMTAMADIGLNFNRKGEFVPPDMILQNRAIEYYQDGKISEAMQNFKRSARFGNNHSKYYIAHLYFEEKNWITGYAWLKLINKPIEKSAALSKKIQSLLAKNELILSAKTLEALSADYNDEKALKRRQKWEKSFKGVGSNIPGIDAMMRRNIRLTVGEGDLPVESTVVRRVVKKYVENGS